MDRIAIAFTIALAGLLLPGAGIADGGSTGPLPVREQFLPSIGFLSFEPTSSKVLDTGEWRLDAVWTVSNSWAVSPQIDLALERRSARAPITVEELDLLATMSSDGGSFFIDGEVSRLMLRAQRGVGKGVQLQILVPALRYGGGFLDRAVEFVHREFGLAFDGRGGASQDAFRVRTSTRRGRVEIDDPGSFGLGNVVLGAKFRLLGTERKLSGALEALVKLPTATSEPIRSSGSTDFGVQLILGRDLGRWSFNGALGALFLGESQGFNLESQRLVTAMVTVERPIGSRSSWTLQLDTSESPFSSYRTGRIGSGSAQGTLGLKRKLGSGGEMFYALTDNIQNFTNSADVTLHIGYTHSIR